MTTTRQDLERESTQYALDEAKQAQKRHGLTDIATAMYMEAAELGFMYAATARENGYRETFLLAAAQANKIGELESEIASLRKELGNE